MSNEVIEPGPERVRIFITGDCDGIEGVRDALAAHPELELVGVAEHVADAASALVGGHLEAVLHVTRSQTLPADELAAIREHTRAPVLMLASRECSALLADALDAGVADVLLLPQPIENVVFAIRKAAHNGRRTQAASGHDGRIVTIFSPKGGTGKTVIATNLAAALAKRERKRTLLLDLDLQFGDAAIMLGIEPEKTIYDLVVAPGELDGEKVAGYITKHVSGLDVLAAPLRPEDAELVTEPRLARLLEVARGSYDAIVVDTSPFFHGPMLATLDRTDELLLVCSLEVPTLKNVRLGLQTFELLSFPRSRVRLVLNRADAKVGLKPSEVEAALETRIAFEIPSDRSVPLSVNRGEPVVLADGGSDFSRSILRVARSMLPAGRPAEQAPRRRLFPTLAKA